MLRLHKTFILVIFLIALCYPSLCYSQPIVGDYLVELGVEFYQAGRYRAALYEFQKALEINPTNPSAKKYLNSLTNELFPGVGLITDQPQEEVVPVSKEAQEQEPGLELESEPIELAEYIPQEREESPSSASKYWHDKKTSSNVKVRGEAIAAFGINSDYDFIWKRANWDLNELDWRMRSNAGFNQMENTYDPGIYDRLRVIVDTQNEEGFNFYTNIAIDPWSFTGKGPRMLITDGTDLAEIELKYWSNTGYTVNETVYSIVNGGAISLPEIKVTDGKIESTVVSGYTIPELEIHPEFMPIREFWVEHNTKNSNFRIFPLGFQDQALTTDDPMRLSNNHIYWEDSPWLDIYRPGNYNYGADNFSPGEFDDQLTWFARNSEGVRLSFLRGFAFSWFDDEDSNLSFTFASPKTLWQDYDSFDTLSGALRAKKRISDSLALGLVGTTKLGFNEEALDSDNFVGGGDFAILATPNIKLEGALAASRSQTDKTTDYNLKDRGNAFQVSLIVNSLDDDMLIKSYDDIMISEDDSSAYVKARIMFTHMDDAFNPLLSTYRQTRNDMFWGRHMHFRDPLEHYYSGLYEPTIGWDDIKPFRIGDSISAGRDVAAFRLEYENFLNGRSDGLFDLRNAHEVSGKYIETIARVENTYRVTPRLTTKMLGIYHDLPHTTGGLDPFIRADDDTYLLNPSIEEDKDASLSTVSLGFGYDAADWFDLYGIWEYTNDYTVAYDDFPRKILNTSWSTTTVIDGKTYRSYQEQLYGQGFFPLPPYPHYDIFKAGINLRPNRKLNIYLNYTRNEYELAGQIDDNINHAGIGIEYLPSEKLTVFLKYVYSRWKDLDDMASGEGLFYRAHHNFFGETRYRFSDQDDFIFQYGVSGKGVISEFLYDPYGGTLPVLDTQHLVRMFYRRKF